MLKLFLWLAGLGVAALLLLFALVHWGIAGELPSRRELSDIRQSEATEVVSADGVVLGKYYRVNRVIVPMADISPWVHKALVATEDARFFEHQGVDLISLGRVIFRTLLAGDRSQGGGSTISQQLAKNLFPRKHASWYAMPAVKMREMIIATRLEGIYDKDALLHLYLNTVPFGDNIHGIEEASRRFYAIPAKDLQAQQAALLVGMLKGNSLYHPARNPERALKRRNTVLERMAGQDVITDAERRRLSALPLAIRYSRESHHEGLAPYFREHIRQEVTDILRDTRREDGERYDLYADGLRVYTTIDSRMQAFAEQAVAEYMVVLQTNFDKEWKGGKPWGSDAVLDRAMRQSDRWKHAMEEGLSEAEAKALFRERTAIRIFTWQGEQIRQWTPLDSIRYSLALLHAGLVAGDPRSGKILAWVGGIDHQHFQYDQVTARRQIGSTFKPVVYAAALRYGFDPCDYFDNVVRTYPDHQDWAPQNASASDTGGVYTMAGALSKSLNTITAALIMETGVSEVRDMAERFGFRGDIPDYPSISLGVADASLLETISLYGTIANGGLRPVWHYIDRIENARGEVIYTHRDGNSGDREEVLSPDEAHYLRYALEMAVDSGTARGLANYVSDVPLAGKTGTTQDQADGWFAGFSPGLVAAVRVGAENPAVHFKSLSSGAGSRTALPIFGRFWRKVRTEPALAEYVTTPFDSIPEEVLAGFRCPYYLPEMPAIAEEEGGFLDALFGDDPEPAPPRPEATPPQQQPRERPVQPAPEKRPSNSFRAWLERTFRR
jgi:penicillin-binding protein 1A